MEGGSYPWPLCGAWQDSDFSHCRPVVESRWRRPRQRVLTASSCIFCLGDRACLIASFIALSGKSRDHARSRQKESQALLPGVLCRCTDQLDFVWHAPHIEQVHFRPRCRGVSHDQSTVQLASKMMPLFSQACDYPQSHLQSLEAASSVLYGMTTLHAAGVCDCSIGADTDFVASSSCWV